MRKTSHKLLSLLICLALALQMVPVSVFAASVASGTSGDVSWSLDSEGVFSVTGVGAMANYASAEEVPWKEYVSQITSVSVGAGVTNVGDYAFEGSANLGEVSLNEDLYRIGTRAFAQCPKLNEITIPGEVLYLGYGAFAMAGEGGLERAYILSRGVEFEEVDYENAATLPKSTVIHGFSGMNPQWYCQRNERIFVPLESGYLLAVDDGESTIELIRDETEVADLWSGIGDDSFVLDYTVTIDADEVRDAYNAMVEEYQEIGTDNHKSGELEVEARLELGENGGDQQPYDKLTLSGRGYYSYEETDLEGEPQRGYLNWYHYDGGEFLTITSSGTELTIHIKATLKQLYEYAVEQNGEAFHLDRIYLYVSVGAQTYKFGYGGYVYDDKYTHVESVHLSVYDAHNRVSEVENYWMTSLDRVYTVVDSAPFGDDRFYEPVSREYTWYYELSKIEYDWDTGEIWGDVEVNPDDDEGTFLMEHNGKLYGRTFGTYEAGADNTFSLRRILNQENTEFIESMIGLGPTGDGGPVAIMLDCSVKLTYADGSEVFLGNRAAEEMTCLIGPCPHTCTVCGMCSAEKMLSCNTNSWGERFSQCQCDEPEVDVVFELVQDADVIDYNVYTEGVSVVVEQVSFAESAKSDYVGHVTRELVHCDIIVIYDISICNAEGLPYQINQYGGEDEYVAVSIPVDADTAQILANGEAGLYHVSEDGNAEPVLYEIDTESMIMSFVGTQFSPYVLVKKASYYGRDALSDFTNADALLYAYDAFVAGVDGAEASFSVYNGADPISQEELIFVRDVYMKDHPEHFWFSGAGSMTADGTTILTFAPSYQMTEAEIDTAKSAFDLAAKEILSGLDSDMSEYERELYLHDQLAARVSYVSGTNAHNAYGALVEGEAVCDGYTEALQYLLQQVGIQSFKATGTSINPSTGMPEGHAWNYVRIDGEYYHVDLTWDDQGENLFHAYFNQTDDVIKEDHALDSVAYGLPVCDSTAAFYFNGKDTKLEEYTVESVGSLLKENSGVVHVYIPGDVSQFETWISENYLGIAGAAGISGSFSYGYSQLGRELIVKMTSSHILRRVLRFEKMRQRQPARRRAATMKWCTALSVMPK